MTFIIIILVLIILIYFLFLNKQGNNTSIDNSKNTQPLSAKVIDEQITEEELGNWLTDEIGRKYKLIRKERELPRQTFIKANLNGKYWGEINSHYSNQFQQSEFYDFNIYEVTLKNAVYQLEEPFQLEEDLRIPREKLPKLLNTILEKDGKGYEVHLHEPIFSKITFNRKLHQSDNNEVFGTIDAEITGYILDFVVEEYFEKEYKVIDSVPNIKLISKKITIEKTLNPTGNIEHKDNYRRIEYFYSDYKKTYWGNWEYKNTTNTVDSKGCLSTLIGIISGILFIVFLLMILPQMVFIIPFLLIIFLLNIIPAKVYSWIFKILGLLVLLMFIIGLIQFFYHQSTSYIPKPVVVLTPEDVKQQTVPIVDAIDNQTAKDSLIIHYRKWQDYDGKIYEGKFWTIKSDYLNARYFKQNFSSLANTEREYDFLIYSLKENDKNKLNGIYQLFDQIQNEQNLSRIKFSELIVSFVQDIPYTVILPDDCNPNLYDDQFIKEYLQSENARCDGFQKFGINSPIEFITTLNGDCDTRTLLLYTILAHYNYDVVLLSSEYYSHSIIGINLPINGIAYQYQNQRYVLWETTASNLKPGIIPKEISNLNYWRISLKSK